MRDGIYDDGEWISWDEISHSLYRQESTEKYPLADIEIVQIFEELVQSAKDYYELTGRYLQIWGELGELYAEIKYGLDRHAPGQQGSDGRLGNDWVEVKTISPEKESNKVFVKRAGNFNKLIIVKFDEDFTFESKIIPRKELSKGAGGKMASVSWKDDAPDIIQSEGAD